MATAQTTLKPQASAATLAAYGRLPLSFEPAAHGSGRFVARTAGAVAEVSSSGMVMGLDPGPSARKAGKMPVVVRFELEGADASAAAHALEELPGRSNYFSGADPAGWRTNVPNFARIEFSNVYPSIDLAYYGNRSGRMEHDFIVRPGADPDRIRIAVQGGSGWTIGASGDLEIALGDETVKLARPVAYQQSSSGQEPVEAAFVRAPDGALAFSVSAYDRSRPLIIDPVLDYSTYLGGGILTGAYGIAVDSSNNAYVVGHAGIGSFPSTSGAYDRSCDSCAFVTKLNATGTALVYSTFLSGGLFDQANAVAVDSLGAAYVAGITESSGFPVTKGAVQTKFGGAFSNGFVTKLNPAGSALEYSTYLGGDGPSTCYRESVGAQADQALGIALDADKNAYVTGCTSSTNFKVTSSAFKKTCTGCEAGYASGFAVKLNTTGTELLYSTFLGGNGLDLGYGIAVDSSNDAYIAGSTTSTNLTVSSTAYQKHLRANGGQNAFVTRLNAAGSGIVYNTYLGGDSVDGALAIAINADDEAYVAGYASSTDFPVTSDAYQKTCKDCENNQTGFVTELNAEGSALVYSTFLGGSGSETITGIAVNSYKDAIVTGGTSSTNFPVTSTAFKKTCTQCNVGNGIQSSFVTELNSAGSGLDYSTYLGGSSSDWGAAVALDKAGNAYVTGSAESTNFPVSAGAYQRSCSACANEETAASVTKFYFGTAPAAAKFSATSVSFGDEGEKEKSAGKTVSLENTGSGPMQVTSIAFAGTDPKDFSGSESCGAAVPAGGACTLTLYFTPQASGSRTATLEVNDNAPGSPQKVDLSGTGVVDKGAVSLTPTSVSFGDVALETVVEKTVTLKNTGTASLNVTAASITTDYSSNFGGSTTCGNDIGPGASCTFTLEFVASAAKTYTATLNVTTTASSTANHVPMTGTGVN